MRSLAVIKDLQRDLEMKGRDVRMFQKDIAKNHRARLKCDAELRESEFFLQELDLLKEDAIVYKLVGPILVKQDLAEPNNNVRKRIGRLAVELGRVDTIIGDLRERQVSKIEKISKVEGKLRSLERGETMA